MNVFYIIALLVCKVVALPENGRWELKESLGQVYSFSKSAYYNTDISAEIICDKAMDLSITWKLLWSECAEAFSSAKMVTDTTKFASLISESRISAELPEKSRQFQCSSDNSVLIKANTTKDGSHLFQLTMSCRDTSQCGEAFKVSLRVDIRSPYGYLSAIEYPLRTFYGILSLAYVMLGFLWLVFTFCHWKHLLRIQYYITLMISMGIIEQITFYALYETLNKDGVAVYSALAFAALISCAKRTLARYLVMITCVGYGITKSRLGTAYRRMVVICLLYFLCSVVDSGILIYHSRFKPSLAVLISGLPLIVIDMAILWWSFSYLTTTLRETRMRRNIVKHRLYRTFSGLLIFVAALSLACMLASMFMLHWKPCTKAWWFIWFDETFWQILFYIVLCTIVILWRPSSTNKLYARSAFLDPDVEPPAEDLEELLFDSIVSGMNSRAGEADRKRSREQAFEHDDEALQWAEKNIPSSTETDRPKLSPQPQRPPMKTD